MEINQIEPRWMARVAETLRHRLAAASLDRENARSLARELVARPAGLRQEAVESDETFASPALGYLLLDRAEALFDGAPREAAHFAGLAHTIGNHLGAAWTLLERDSLQGCARSVQGEALRRLGRLAEARQAHLFAFRHFEALPAGCAERASFCRYLARLRRDQGRDDEALALMGRALERHAAFRDLQNRRRAQACRLELAWMHLDDLESDEALSHFEAARFEEAALGLEPERPGAGGTAVGDLDGWGDREGGSERKQGGSEGGEPGAGPPFGRLPEGWLSLRHGLALAYADLRNERAARAMVAEIAGGAGGLRGGRGIDPLRAKLVEASVLQRLDANEEAAELLFTAWSGYVLRGEPYEAALALLELAQLRAEQGSEQDFDRLKEGVSHLSGLGENVREPILLGLEVALRNGLDAVERLESLKRFVETARHDPEARFVVEVGPAGLEKGED